MPAMRVTEITDSPGELPVGSGRPGEEVARADMRQSDAVAIAIRRLDVAHPCYILPVPRAITLRRVGGSVGTTLPKEMVDRLDLAAGDRVLAIETEQGILITPYTEDLEVGLAATRRAAKRYRAALRELVG